jgi:EAL domain-containing protein (putative c-di-GMP-specific phosphodiesterase class I)
LRWLSTPARSAESDERIASINPAGTDFSAVLVRYAVPDYGRHRLTMDANRCVHSRRKSPPDRGTLYLSSPSVRTAVAIQDALERAGLPTTEVDTGLFATPFSSRWIGIWRNVFSGTFTSSEMDLTKVCLLAEHMPLLPTDLMQALSLPDFLAWLDSQWLTDVLESKRLFTVFQPIVHVEQPGRIYSYECLVRGRTVRGEFVTADRLFAAARITGLLGALDQAALRTAFDATTEHGLPGPVFVNIYPNAIQQSAQFLENAIAAAESAGLSPGHFVFEFVESEEIADPTGFFKVLEAVRAQGFRVALDDVGAGYSSLNVLVHVKPDFMKLDMGLIRDVDRDIYKSCVASKLLELAQELNVCTVVEGIETIGEWQWSKDHGANFAQGYLFARPECPPPVSKFDGRDPQEREDNGYSNVIHSATV